MEFNVSISDDVSALFVILWNIVFRACWYVRTYIILVAFNLRQTQPKLWSRIIFGDFWECIYGITWRNIYLSTYIVLYDTYQTYSWVVRSSECSLRYHNEKKIVRTSWNSGLDPNTTTTLALSLLNRDKI